EVPAQVARGVARRVVEAVRLAQHEPGPAHAAENGAPAPRAEVDGEMQGGACHNAASELLRRERPARAAERFPCRLAPDPLRRETVDDEECGAERAAFRSRLDDPRPEPRRRRTRLGRPLAVAARSIDA